LTLRVEITAEAACCITQPQTGPKPALQSLNDYRIAAGIKPQFAITFKGI
jgi:hypothetical protein